MRAFRLTLLAAVITAWLAGCSMSRSGPPATSTSPTSAEETSTTSAEPSRDEDEPPPLNDEPITSNSADCVDGQCRLPVSGPVKIPLDASRYYYPEVWIIAVTADSLTFQLPFEGRGGTSASIGAGGSAGIGHDGPPLIWLTLETGSTVINLTPSEPL